MKPLATALVILLIPSALLAEAGRYVKRHILPDGRSAVVAEGDLEPRSIGSYSVRFYAIGNSQFPTDDFQAGIILNRNGYIEKVEWADIDDDNVPELIILIRCVGTGGYLSADAISVKHDKPVVVSRVMDLDKNADAVATLRMQQKPETEQDKSSESAKPRH